MHKHSIRAAALLLFSSQACADNINVDFTATILETTCAMKLQGGTGSDAYKTLTIGTGGLISLDKIVLRDPSASASFSIIAQNCSAGTSKISTKITATASGVALKLIVPASGSSSTTNFIGVGIYRASASDASMFTLNSDGALVWTASELTAGKVDLIVALRETQSGSGTPGIFNATATFSFSYE